MGQIRWTEKSSKNLEAVFEYIAHDSVLYAARFIKSLIKSTRVLEKQPFIGRIVPELNDKSIREIFYRDYRIVYKVVKDENIEIIAVYHGARDFSSIEFQE